MTSTAPTLIVLRDFDHWFRQLPLRLPGVSQQILEPLRGRILDALRTVAEVEPHELSAIRHQVEARRQPHEYVLTLDGGTYFRQWDFSFAMTRAVTRVTDSVKGGMIRVAREGFGQFWTQVAVLRREFEASDKNSIILCDDGIDTGRSLAEVVRQLSEQFLEVDSIRVLLNPNGLSTVEQVPVEVIYPRESVSWTHERDLFWGSPTGGVSLLTRNNVNVLGGIPYSLSSSLLARRLGLSHTDLKDLRKALLEVNRDFWAILERAAGRPLRLRDNKRLLWATEVGGFTERSIITDVISWLIENEPDL